MLHNKYLGILYHLLGDFNKEIYGRGLVKSLRLSQKNIALTLNELELKNILTSTSKGNIRFYKLNIRNSLIQDIIKIVELSKKIEFLEKNKVLKHILVKQDKRIVGIFGSYAKARQKKDSDIDLFIVGEKNKKDYDALGKEYDFKISIKYFKEQEFKNLCRVKNNLVKEMIANHIIISSVKKFIEIIWRDFYGYN